MYEYYEAIIAERGIMYPSAYNTPLNLHSTNCISPVNEFSEILKLTRHSHDWLL